MIDSEDGVGVGRGERGGGGEGDRPSWPLFVKSLVRFQLHPEMLFPGACSLLLAFFGTSVLGFVLW